MPIYEYNCENCDHYGEFLEKMGAPALRKCPACGKRKFRRIVSLTSFQLKGDGWYVTDFRDKDKKKPKDGAASDSKDSDAKQDKAKADEGKSGKAKDEKTKAGADAPKDKGDRKKAGKAPEAA